MSGSENPMEIEASSANRSIGRRPSQRQKLALLDWLEKNIEIVSDKFGDGDGVGIREREVIWEEIASYLNSLGEAKKNGFKWRKFWMDLRSYTKNKWAFIRQVQQDSSATSLKKKPLKNKTLSPIEKRVLLLITPTRTYREETIANFIITSADTFREESTSNIEMEIGPTVKIEKCYSPIFEIEESVSPVMKIEDNFSPTIKIDENSVESSVRENLLADSAGESNISKKRRKPFSIATTNKKLINIEKEKLKIEKAKLSIKREKLKVAKELLIIQKKNKEVLQAILEQMINIRGTMSMPSIS